MQNPNEFVCQVCNAPNKSAGKYYKHYGATSCYGCKSFFRRATHMKGYEKYKCYSDSRCVMDFSIRNKCQRCRYLKCLKVGMQQDKVQMDDKKVQMLVTTFVPPFIADQPGNHGLEEQKSVEYKYDLQLTDIDSIYESFDRLVFDGYDGQIDNFFVVMLQKTYSFASASIAVDPQVIADLIKFQMGDTEHTMAFKRMRSSYFGVLFLTFADLLPLFKTLPTSYKYLLLESNAPLFLAYIQGRYFGAETGFDQLNAMIGPHMPMLSLDEVGKLKVMTLRRFSMDFSCFETAEAYGEYKRRVNETPIFKLTSPIYESLLAALLLFNTDGIGELSKSKYLSRISDTVQGFLPILDMTKEEFQGFIVTLTRMNELLVVQDVSDRHVATEHFNQEVIDQCLRPSSIPYTNNEFKWLQFQLWCFQDAFSSISTPEDQIKAFLVTADPNNTTEINGDLALQSLHLHIERMRRVMKINCSFNRLSDDQQNHLWKRNSKTGLMLCLAKIHALKSAKEQLKFCLGQVSSDESWQDEFRGIVKMDELTFISMDHINNDLGYVNRDVVDLFFTLIHVVGRFVCDNDIFKIMTFIVMFDDDEDTTPAFIRNTYLDLLDRLLMIKQHQPIETSFFMTGGDYKSSKVWSFMNVLYQVKRCAKVLIPAMLNQAC